MLPVWTRLTSLAFFGTGTWSVSILALVINSRSESSSVSVLISSSSAVLGSELCGITPGGCCHPAAWFAALSSFIIFCICSVSSSGCTSTWPTTSFTDVTAPIACAQVLHSADASALDSSISHQLCLDLCLCISEGSLSDLALLLTWDGPK